jgi:hypothetical protein
MKPMHYKGTKETHTPCGDYLPGRHATNTWSGVSCENCLRSIPEEVILKKNGFVLERKPLAAAIGTGIGLGLFFLVIKIALNDFITTVAYLKLTAPSWVWVLWVMSWVILVLGFVAFSYLNMACSFIQKLIDWHKESKTKVD